MNEKTKLLIADTFAAVTFSLVVATSIEYFSGLTILQIIKSRAVGGISSSIFGRPYGKYRDFIFSKMKISNSFSIKKSFGDVFVFCTFWLPIYITTLYLIGTGWKQIFIACATTAALFSVIAIPNNWYLDKIRKLFGIESKKEDLNTVNLKQDVCKKVVVFGTGSEISVVKSKRGGCLWRCLYRCTGRHRS